MELAGALETWPPFLQKLAEEGRLARVFSDNGKACVGIRFVREVSDGDDGIYHWMIERGYLSPVNPRKNNP